MSRLPPRCLEAALERHTRNFWSQKILFAKIFLHVLARNVVVQEEPAGVAGCQAFVI